MDSLFFVTKSVFTMYSNYSVPPHNNGRFAQNYKKIYFKIIRIMGMHSLF